MSHSLFFACLGAMVVGHAAFAQTSLIAAAGNTPALVTAAPIAYVYVSNTVNQIVGFSASTTGKLTAIPGSPFKGTGGRSMAANGKYLFGEGTQNIYSYSIASNGALKPVASFNAQKYNPDGAYGSPALLFLDHTGATLYTLIVDDDNNPYQAFKINNSNGELTFIWGGGGARGNTTPMTFTGKNVFAYAANQFYLNPRVFGFQRNSNGTITEINADAPMPAAKPGDVYLPVFAVADPANHVAVAIYPEKGAPFGPQDGPELLATYTADAAGNLSTSSIYKNMPGTAAGSVNRMRMSPSGKLLAVAGSAGLQVFHYNGASPITKYTGLLVSGPVSMAYWDNANHLYALGANKLYVFTVTPTSVSQVAGSPYAIAKASALLIQPK
jgi:6-phosphogluconolactonase (cycloisomerase 2 family)